MSYVLFRLHQPQKQEDDRKQNVDLIKVLRESLPELGGRIYEAEDLENDGQSGVILQVSTDERFRAARQVRTILREKGLAHQEGVLTEQVAVQSVRGRREDAERCFEAGKAFSHLGMLDEAIVEFEQALTYDPMFTEAYHYLTAIYRQQGANDEALCLLEDGARFQGHEASFQYLYGKLLTDLGHREQALERLKAAVRLNPRAAEPYLLIGKMFLEDGDLEGSELSFLQALTHGPRTPEASLGLGSISLSRGGFDAAEDHLLDALDMNQELDEARLMLGWTYFRDGRMEQAEV